VDELIALYNTRRFADAEDRARALVVKYPNFSFGWKLLGGALQMQGKDALPAFKKVVELVPGDAEAHYNLGIVQRSLGQLDNAVASYSRAVKLKPDYAEAFNNLGNIFKELGRFDDAVTSYRRTLKVKPESADAHNNLGIVLKELKQFDGAIASYRRAIQLKPDFTLAHYNLGNAQKELRLHAQAVASYKRAIECKPDFADAHSNLGAALKELGNYDAALSSCRRALELKPDYAEAHRNLGIMLLKNSLLTEAEASFRRALELKVNDAETHNNLGILLVEARRLSEAEASYRRALQLKPDYAEACNNLGILFVEVQRLQEAEAFYRRALEVKPDHAEFIHNLSILLLSLGRYAEAWPYYEYRYNPSITPPICEIPNLHCPQWRGESLLGKSIVIWKEQGYGDNIQFARYVRLLRVRGVSHLTLACAPPLKALLETVPGVDEVITELAATASYDYWTFPLSLPLHFGTIVDTIPQALPYLYALQARVDRWRDRVPTGKLKVGLVWKGSLLHMNDANRSLPGLHTLAPLWSVPGVAFISLQKGQGEDEAKNPPADQPIVHLGSGIVDFADTAAIVELLDLVICVDTSIAHLAGAMCKPCWVLLPAVGTDWRWLREREDSPWYASLRIFRQKVPSEWCQLVECIRQELLTVTHAGS
jgi:tetratricopeptide (TPR) repeat protein